MKQILTYTNLDINGTAVRLFTAGKQGLIFTQAFSSGITLALETPSGATSAMPADLVGRGLGFGHSLLATGNGDISVTMYGELEQYYRIVNTDQLEVIVGYPVLFDTSGVVGGYSVTSGFETWIPQGVYSDNTYSISSNGVSLS